MRRTRAGAGGEGAHPHAVVDERQAGPCILARLGAEHGVQAQNVARRRQLIEQQILGENLNTCLEVALAYAHKRQFSEQARCRVLTTKKARALTLSTSTTSVERRSRATGNESSTASIDKIDVARMTTSGCCAGSLSAHRATRERRALRAAHLLNKVVCVSKEGDPDGGGDRGVVRARGGNHLASQPGA